MQLTQNGGTSVAKRFTSLVSYHLTLASATVGSNSPDGNKWKIMMACSNVTLVVNKKVIKDCKIHTSINVQLFVKIFKPFVILDTIFFFLCISGLTYCHMT